VDWKPKHIADGAVLAACAAVVLAGLLIGSSRSVANFGHERDFYDTWAPRADAPFDLSHYTRGENDLGYPLLRNHPPGYSLLVAAGNTITGDSFRSAVILSALAAGLFGWVSYLLLVVLFGREQAAAGTILLLIAVVPYSFIASTDLVGALTIALPLWALLRKPVPGSADLLLAGALAGAAYLVRSQAIFLVIGFVLVVPILARSAWREPDAAPPRTRWILRQTAYPLIGFLAVTGPWMFLNWKLNGSPMYSTAHLQVAMHYWDPSHDVRLSAYWRASEKFDSLAQVVMFDPVSFVRLYLKQILLQMPRSIGVDVLGYPGFFLFGGGFIFLLAGLNVRRFSWLFILLLGYLLLGLVNIVGRYFIFLYPALYFTVALVAFAPVVREQFRRLRIPAALGSWTFVVLTALLMLRDARIETRKYTEAEPRFLLELAQSLRERAGPGDRVMVHEPHIPYLSGVEAAVVDGETVEAVIANGRRQGVRFYVYDRVEADEWPGRRGLADPDSVPAGLHPIYVHEASGTVLYELDPPTD